MGEKLDLRVQRTYDALISAFKELVITTSFDKITVTELCKKAKIRTATFYTHFQDKYDFFNFMVEELRNKYFEEHLFQDGPKQSADFYLTIIRCCIEYCADNREFLKALDSDISLMYMLRNVSDKLSRELQKYIEIDKERGVKFHAEPMLVVQVVSGAITQSLRWWIIYGKDMTKEELYEQLAAIIKDASVFAAPESPQEN